MKSPVKILIQGIGNPIRGDDSLGPKLIEELCLLRWANVDCEWLYQLQVEQAEQWTRYDCVLLVDAHKDLESATSLQRLSENTAERSLSATPIASHEVSPTAIYELARSIFKFHGEVYVLALRGSSFELGTSLSEEAADSYLAGLQKTKEFIDAIS